MTDQQLEKAARHYCSLIGLNPDERVNQIEYHTESSWNTETSNWFCYQWQNFVEPIRRQDLINEAIRVGKTDVYIQL